MLLPPHRSLHHPHQVHIEDRQLVGQVPGGDMLKWPLFGRDGCTCGSSWRTLPPSTPRWGPASTSWGPASTSWGPPSTSWGPPSPPLTLEASPPTISPSYKSDKIFSQTTSLHQNFDCTKNLIASWMFFQIFRTKIKICFEYYRRDVSDWIKSWISTFVLS